MPPKTTEGMKPELKRFLQKVKVVPNGCWLWQGYKQHDGYSQFFFQGKHSGAHRFAYQEYKGLLIEGMQIDHLCKVADCVNPDHLEQVTPRENTLRSNNTAAQNARLTECRRGHVFDTLNTRYSHGGRRRHCRICEKMRARINYWKNKEALTPPDLSERDPDYR